MSRLLSVAFDIERVRRRVIKPEDHRLISEALCGYLSRLELDRAAFAKLRRAQEFSETKAKISRVKQVYELIDNLERLEGICGRS